MELMHMMLRVKNIEESLKFYTELLEMKVDREKRLDDSTLYFLTDEKGIIQLELTFNDETPENGYEIGTGFGHLAFKVSSMDEFTQKMNALGYKYLYEPYKLSSTGSTIAFVRDPDGYEIELIERI